MSNLSIPIHNIWNFIHIHMPHTLNIANQPILQFRTIRGENSVACNESRASQEPSLRREKCSRSSCMLSLRWDRDRGLERFCERSLRRGHLAWARWSFAQNSIRSLERVLEQNSWARFCYSRLGKMSLLGRKSQNRGKTTNIEIKQPTYNQNMKILASFTWKMLIRDFDTKPLTQQF